MAKIVETGEKIAQQVVEGYKKIENGVVEGYKKIENGVVEGYKKVEDKCVETMFAKEASRLQKETTSLCIARLTAERNLRIITNLLSEV